MENEIRDFLEFNGNEYATCTILINTKKINVVHKRKFIPQMPTYWQLKSTL